MKTNDKPSPYWPFPQECPPKLWTPKEIKAYEKLQREKAQESPL